MLRPFRHHEVGLNVAHAADDLGGTEGGAAGVGPEQVIDHGARVVAALREALEPVEDGEGIVPELQKLAPL